MKEKIKKLLAEKQHVVVAIDGMAASGKTTAAEQLTEQLGGEVIHMDDFFLPPEMRTEERLSQPGGNVHYERFMTEVAGNLSEGEPLTYGVFDCSSMRTVKKEHIECRGLVIVEGAYALRPEFRHLYDYKVFMKTDAETQMRRILQRGGPLKAQAFEEKWIPLEEAYFRAMAPAETADEIIFT